MIDKTPIRKIAFLPHLIQCIIVGMVKWNITSQQHIIFQGSIGIYSKVFRSCHSTSRVDIAPTTSTTKLIGIIGTTDNSRLCLIQHKVHKGIGIVAAVKIDIQSISAGKIAEISFLAIWF